MQRDGPPRPSVCQMTGRIKCKDEKKKKKKKKKKTYVEVDMELLNSTCHIDRRGAEVNMIESTVQ